MTPLTHPELPYVVVACGMSVDGRVALRAEHILMEQDEGRVMRSAEAASGLRLDDLREHGLARDHRPGAVLEGSGSLVTRGAGPLDGLPPPSRPPDELLTDHLPSAVTDDPAHRMWFTVVDGRGRVRWHDKGSDGWDVLVLVAESTPPRYLDYLQQEGICYLVSGREQVDLRAALVKMRSRLGVACVVSKAGGGLNGALLRAGLIDELQLIVHPMIIGGLGTPSLVDGSPLADGEPPVRLELSSAHVESDGALLLSYRVTRPREGDSSGPVGPRG